MIASSEEAMIAARKFLIPSGESSGLSGFVPVFD
jgi:hypothetical protein